jgi:hypothetical protein
MVVPDGPEPKASSICDARKLTALHVVQFQLIVNPFDGELGDFVRSAFD